MICKNGFWTLVFWIPTKPPRKSNQRRKADWGGFIKSEEALAYEELFRAETLEWVYEMRGSLPLRDFITVHCIVFYEDDRPDLSIELILDCLEKSGIIDNDRHVREFTAVKCYGEPGALIVVSGKDAGSD